MSQSPVSPAPNTVSDIARFAFVGLGAVALVLGIIVVALPSKTAVLLSVIFGIYFIVSGIIRVAQAIALKSITVGLRIFLGIIGVLLVIAGAYILTDPIVGAITIGLLIGISWIFEGVATLILPTEDGKRGWSIFGAIVTILAGIIVLFIPLAALDVLIIVTGIGLIVVGIVTIVHGFRLGKAINSLE